MSRRRKRPRRSAKEKEEDNGFTLDMLVNAVVNLTRGLMALVQLFAFGVFVYVLFVLFVLACKLGGV